MTARQKSDERGNPRAADEAGVGTKAVVRSTRAMSEESLHRLLIESVRDYAIFALDPRGHVVTWNAGAERIKGYSASDIIGQHFSVFYPPEDNIANKPGEELRVAVRDGRLEDEGWRVRKDGTLFWANVIITALFNEHRELVGFAKITRDLTERRAAQERAMADALRLASAEAANNAKSEFLTALSHELRTPLNAIGGYAELLELGVRGPISPEMQQDLARIRASQQHLLGIINDLLSFSRIEAGRINYTFTSFPVDEVAHRVSSMIESQAVSRGLTLGIAPTAAPVMAYADRARVEQILLNLLSNAIKYTESGGRISVQAELNGDRALVHVRDTGVGIPADQQENIFEPFVQLGRSLTTQLEGTGIGLAISRDLARAMDGDLTVESAAGIGSTFTLALPVGPSAESS